MLRDSTPRPPTYLRNIQTGKSKKKTLIRRRGQGRGEESSATAHYLCKEHREGKKGEKILVSVRFSGSCQDERDHRGRTRTGA